VADKIAFVMLTTLILYLDRHLTFIVNYHKLVDYYRMSVSQCVVDIYH